MLCMKMILDHNLDIQIFKASPIWRCIDLLHIPANDNLREENHHMFLIIEHDPMHYEDAEEMADYLAWAL